MPFGFGKPATPQSAGGAVLRPGAFASPAAQAIRAYQLSPQLPPGAGYGLMNGPPVVVGPAQPLAQVPPYAYGDPYSYGGGYGGGLTSDYYGSGSGLEVNPDDDPGDGGWGADDVDYQPSYDVNAAEDDAALMGDVLSRRATRARPHPLKRLQTWYRRAVLSPPP